MISLLIIAHEQEEQLATHLPELLSQEGVAFEVVVVDMNSEDNTLQMLNSLEAQHKHLRHITLPTSARDISRERLALHLGFRTADYQQVLVLNCISTPPSPHWLADIAKRWRTDCDILVVPGRRNRTTFWKDLLTARHEAWHTSLHERQATRHNLYRCASGIVGVRKDLFVTQNMSASRLALKTGTLDIFVAHSANKHNCILITEEALFPLEDAVPGTRYWKQKRLFLVETNRHMPQRIRRQLTYALHIVSTLHRWGAAYALLDLYDYIRWLFTSRNTFLKKHY